METVLKIISALSLLTFVVGMFSPKTVKCSSRGKVALIFIGLLLVSGLIGTSLSEETKLDTNKEVTNDTTTKKRARKDQGDSNTHERLHVHYSLCKQ